MDVSGGQQATVPVREGDCHGLRHGIDRNHLAPRAVLDAEATVVATTDDAVAGREGRSANLDRGRSDVAHLDERRPRETIQAGHFCPPRSEHDRVLSGDGSGAIVADDVAVGVFGTGRYQEVALVAGNDQGLPELPRAPMLKQALIRLALLTHPPSCPPSLSEAVPPVVAPALTPPAGNKPAFQSTFKICYQQLTTRAFKVPDGGVTLQLSGDWARRLEHSDVACPTDDYEVTLHRSNLLFDDDMGTATVPVGGQSVEWRELAPGDYYFTIVAPPHSPLCCLQGDVAVSTFHAPIPLPMDPGMIA